MSAQFVGEKITVTTTGTIKQPVSFHWRDREYQVTAILASWFDWGFSPGAKQKDWRTRRHRNYFRVRTDSGLVCEIYLDRATPTGAGEWYLYQFLEDATNDEHSPTPS